MSHGLMVIYSGILFGMLILILLIPINSYAKVMGDCSNCHAMHNSQDGTDVDPYGPNDSLLRVTDCLGCHGATDGSTWQGIGGAPIVYNASPPQYGVSYGGGPNQGLAGGNFYWVGAGTTAEYDNKGHNIFNDNPDEALSGGAPGRSIGCTANNACHINLNEAYDPPGSGLPGLKDRQGCTGCHMLSDNNGANGFHHADDPSPVVNGTPWYRFLQGHQSGEGHGVTGIEDDDWQHSSNNSDHNEYLGLHQSIGNKSNNWGLKDADTMTAFCCGCHGNFHDQERTIGSWVRHPSDAVIPNSGEYSDYTIYDPMAPVARPDLSGGVSGTVTPDTDMVMCLSCHRPHGSPYPDMLRWDYNDMVAGGGGTTGCFVCHTEKDGF